MFSFFNKTPKSNNKTHIELSEMFWKDTTNPIYNIDFIDSSKLDFSIESLKHVDEYLELAYNEQLDDEAYITIVMRVGSYVGEVIRKQLDTYNWLEYKEAKKANKMIKEYGLELSSLAVLWEEPDNFLFPFGKVDKFLTNGSEDSTYAFVTILIAQNNNEIKTV